MTPARLHILAALALAAGCRSATPTPTALATPIAALDSTQWRADLHFLATELERRHRKAFFHVSRDAFYKETAAIDANIPRFSAPEIVFRFKRLVALIGDGHTTGPTSSPTNGVSRSAFNGSPTDSASSAPRPGIRTWQARAWWPSVTSPSTRRSTA